MFSTEKAESIFVLMRYHLIDQLSHSYELLRTDTTCYTNTVTLTSYYVEIPLTTPTQSSLRVITYKYHLLHQLNHFYKLLCINTTCYINSVALTSYYVLTGKPYSFLFNEKNVLDLSCTVHVPTYESIKICISQLLLYIYFVDL